MNGVCAVLLAGGTSSRMGELKQLLKWGNQTLLEYQLERLCSLQVEKVTVVLGHEAEKIRKSIHYSSTKLSFITCEGYREGLSASLKRGLEASRNYSGALLMLVDLPFIRQETMEKVLEKGISILKEEIAPFCIQPSFRGLSGHPVFIGHFAKINWDSLHGDKGAKPVIEKLKRRERIETNDMGVTFDMDTMDAYMKARQYAKNEK